MYLKLKSKQNQRKRRDKLEKDDVRITCKQSSQPMHLFILCVQLHFKLQIFAKLCDKIKTKKFYFQFFPVDANDMIHWVNTTAVLICGLDISKLLHRFIMSV